MAFEDDLVASDNEGEKETLVDHVRDEVVEVRACAGPSEQVTGTAMAKNFKDDLGLSVLLVRALSSKVGSYFIGQMGHLTAGVGDLHALKLSGFDP